MSGRPTAFVTGASQGIGAASAVALARGGYDVALSSTRIEKLDGVLEEIRAAGAKAVPVALDVRSASSIDQAMQSVLAALGALDVLVNNAAVTAREPALDVTPDSWNLLMQTNVSGTFFMSQRMGRHLVGTGRPGAIINIASTHGLVGVPDRLTYGVTKGAMIQMTRLLAVEWAPHRIRVNAVAPGRVDTPSRADTYKDPQYIAGALKRVPLGRFGTAAEIAAAVCYLASPAAAYITGQTLTLDGGVTAA